MEPIENCPSKKMINAGVVTRANVMPASETKPTICGKAFLQ